MLWTTPSGHLEVLCPGGQLFPSIGAPTETTSKFWGVNWHKGRRRWEARYYDATDKRRSIGYFDTQEQAAHAVNAAILALPPDVQRRRKTNPVVDGQLVPPQKNPASGHGRRHKRRRHAPAAAARPQ